VRGVPWTPAVGSRFGLLTVLELVGNNVRCLCDCGKETTPTRSNVKRGLTQSCGHQMGNPGQPKPWASKHGATNTAEYRTWCAIRSRCHTPSNKDFGNYGARGVTVCQRWRDSFDAFFADMGRRPSPRHSIERKDNAKGYEPSNCVWATATEQGRNRRSVKLDEAAAADIRRRVAAGEKQNAVARAYGVTPGNITAVIQGKTWKTDNDTDRADRAA
jgi:hypothetical protein